MAMTDSKPDDAPASRKPTMGDVAARAGVSRQLVSLVLNDARGPSARSRDRVRQAADELGYSPDIAAQMLRSKARKHLGVLFTLSHGSGAEIVEQMHAAAAVRGYNLVLGVRSPTRTEGAAIEELIGYRCEALILISTSLSSAALRRLSRRLPVVAVGHGSAGAGYDVVHSAGDTGIGLAVDHVAELGHRQIAYVHGKDMPGGELRHRGYLTAAGRHGIRPDVLTLRGDYTDEIGARAAVELLARPQLPTAVVAANDHAAAGLLTTLSRSGIKIPDDISITGYDDSRIARLSFYDLTSVRQDPAEIGHVAIDCALSRISGERQKTERRVTSTSLVVRSSTTRPRADLVAV
jgi:DNA-binding LacI/PurR family transcriptional regulator